MLAAKQARLPPCQQGHSLLTLVAIASGVVAATLLCTQLGPSSTALAATVAEKSASSLDEPPGYCAAARRGSVTVNATRGLTRGLKMATDVAVTAAGAVVLAGGGGAAAATLTTPVMWKSAAAALRVTFGWRMDSTAR
jgi:hypothetical protein